MWWGRTRTRERVGRQASQNVSAQHPQRTAHLGLTPLTPERAQLLRAFSHPSPWHFENVTVRNPTCDLGQVTEPLACLGPLRVCYFCLILLPVLLFFLATRMFHAHCRDTKGDRAAPSIERQACFSLYSSCFFSLFLKLLKKCLFKNLMSW